MNTTRHFLTAPEVAVRLRCSVRTIHELARHNQIPVRRLPGSRPLLFRADHLDAWENGAQLEVIELPRGGRIVRPSGGSRPRETSVTKT